MSLPHPPIEEILPHRYPFLFIDSIASLDSGRSILCLYRVPEDQPYLDRRHASAVFPSSLVVEALGQTAAICIHAGRTAPVGKPRTLGYLVRIDLCSFNHRVHGGDELQLAASLVAGYGPLHKFDVRAMVGTQQIVTAALTLYSES